MNQFLDLHEEVQEAIHKKKAVVALESTIISHGMPYPQNLEMAKTVENIIREQGAVPATIAVLDGKMKAGLGQKELEFLAENRDVKKLSRRDLPTALAMGWSGATTVATTMYIAECAGIKVFATGGIGGVHRGAEKSFDISADLIELSKTSVAVICAGAKSILDIGLTLEYLETQGVPVIGLNSSIFPAFYTPRSRFSVNANLSEEETARTMYAKWQSGLAGGLVIANPVPEKMAMDEETINQYIAQALEECESLQQQGKLQGKEVTPYLLRRISELSEGSSLETNIALVKHNAQKAAEIALFYQKLIS
jgi:pseudouridine-5'-phosphate glycosidase